MIILPSKIKIIPKKSNLTIFEISGLHPGYGTTLGNSLRRVLLSSLSGAAITKFKIKGTGHEFSTIPHVLEDILSIGLNLKQLRFKVHSEEPQKIFLKIKGEQKVKSGDFEAHNQVELVNKNVHIATLTNKKADLEIEAWVEKGIGYFTVEDYRRRKVEVDIIEIDAVFSPIRNVSFEVKNMRVEIKINFDRLRITIETDDTITPTEALVEACRILNKHFLFLENYITIEKQTEKKDNSTVEDG